MSQACPMDILQSFLDEAAEALLKRDPDSFFSHFHFPHVWITDDTEMVAQSSEALLERFQYVSSALIGHGVTQYIRIARQAQFLETGEICGEWQAHIMRDDQRLVPPFPGRARLVPNEDGKWRASHVVSGAKFGLKPLKFPIVADTPKLRDIDMNALNS